MSEAYKIRCNNCMEIFDEEGDLATLVEHHEGQDDEFFRGCADCNTDEYLMEIPEPYYEE